MSLLEVAGLQAGYETGQVLFGVDLSVEEDEVVSLLGRNGAGKTTTMHAIVGANVPTVLGGEIRFDGTDLRERRNYQISELGLSLVPEGRRCFRDLTVEENLRLAANHAEDPLSIDDVWDQFPELKDMHDRPSKNMSGGEQQMLAIARSLITNPQLILMDEPCEGLAPLIVRRIESIIKDINGKRDVSVLLVEQNVAVAMAVAERHYVIDEGEIVEELSTEQLRKDEALRQEYLGV
ncbi:ABC transporter, high-affinity branched-chain amino acid transport ATP-binding protein LivF [Halogeometricum pallidum JCM 14848]|uniref:ABC transporter, high-affinity branched-chain amino acid transport ATP-binding protein LivF n=1 Tax=Halogeometricum pallidum JCM 14848 TaxID=1227487 RepID=M0CZT5_HALPD|nr:ABC transporter ATP-binding protein [Halogeometricum pallidum]ELZ28756.1 ABC transporter, high-affinity branched-chain amino acid transport ATP-binding protein LivF [Halogeometricum pallidum JCM 14848]